MHSGGHEMRESAVLLANGLLRTNFAKTTHGLVRGPSRFQIAGVVDPECAGSDAGDLLDGRHRGVMVYRSLGSLIEETGRTPKYCIVGVATVGGVLPQAIREGLAEAASHGMTLVNGLHHLLSEDRGLVELTEAHGGGILDLRKPRPVSELGFWTGEILSLEVPRVAVLGTDCALGKRTTCWFLREALAKIGLRAEIVYTGQTGWLQGLEFGFVLDATPNDFVCGELEKAILQCARACDPDLILLEGQSGLRYPAGPCGAELIVSAGVSGVVMLHAPGRTFYEGTEDIGCRIPPVSEEIELVRGYGSEVWAVCIHSEELSDEGLDRERARLREELQIPVVYPLGEGVGEVAEAIRDRLSMGHA